MTSRSCIQAGLCVEARLRQISGAWNWVLLENALLLQSLSIGDEEVMCHGCLVID